LSPKAPRSKRGELPKPVIQPGALGFFPFNALSVAYIRQGCGNLILGYHDRPETLALKANPKVQVHQGKTRQSLSLDGRFYNGLTDALYRGRLPQVIIASPSAEELGDFLTDIVEYLEKMLSMGFFLPRKELLKRDPVEDLVPCIILTGNGIVFSRFITGLARYLREFENQHPVMNEALRLRILGRFVRGLSDMEEQAIFSNVENKAGSERVLEAVEVPTLIRIAGGGRKTHLDIQKVLGLHGLVASIENRVGNAVERLEFENALWRVSHVVIPALVETKAVKATQRKTLSRKLESGIFSIGRKRQVFDETETADALASAKSNGSRPDREKPALALCDATILAGLSAYAGSLGLDEERKLFETLAVQVADRIKDQI
jgi:hypothetical protein